MLSLLTGNSIDRLTFAQDVKLGQHKPAIKRTDSLFTSSSIEGNVADVTEAVIVGAQITLINQQTKRETTTKTSTIGKFRFQSVEPGNYTIKVFSPGFKAFVMLDIQIAANEIIEIPLGMIAMEVGATLGELIAVEDNIKTSDHTLPIQINRKEKPREQ
ncbi:MAG: carboxypeptidase-like regulatory domain-containing protein [Acidobacteriota bacterium]